MTMKNSSHAYKGKALSKGTRSHTKITRGVRAIRLGRLLHLLDQAYKKKEVIAQDHDRAEWLTVKELATYCGISERKLRALIRTELPHVKVGRLVRISRAEFDDWMRAQRVEKPAPAPVQLVRDRKRYSLDDRARSSSTAHDVKSLYKRRVTT
jgi:excisionase family DNA binding protein